MKKKRIIPFGLTLAGLTLKGEHRDVAKAYYDLDGEDLERRLLELTVEDEKERKIKTLELDRKYEHISKKDYDYKLIELKYKDSDEASDLPFARLQLDKKYGKLTEKEFDKAVHSLGNRPWIDVIHSEYNDSEGADGFAFELDWNEAFIKLLISEGYFGPSDEAIVEQWFEDKALDTYLGVLAEQMHEIGEDPQDAHRSIGRGKTIRETLKDNRSRHS